MNKKLSNPPVYYTVVQAQFNPVANMTNYINEIQDKLRLDGYTLFDAQKITQLHFKPTTSPPSKAEVLELPLWRFTKTDRKSGFILSQTHLAYHTTHYQTHSHFFDAFLHGLQQVHSIVKLDHLSRLGLRYLNAVLPKENESVNQYLAKGLHGIQTETPLRYALSESVFDTKIQACLLPGTIVNRVYFRFGSLSYPPDIPPHELVHMPKFIKENNLPYAVIDIDHFVQEQIPVDFKQMMLLLISLHTEIKKFLKSGITSHAQKVWGDE